MDIVEFIFAIIAKFAPVPQSRIEQLKSEALQWYDQTIKGHVYSGGRPTGEVVEPTNKIVTTVRPHLEAWYTKTGLALVFLWAVRAVSDWMQGGRDDED